jgi:hypothetical protein
LKTLKQNFELLFLIAALVALGFSDPVQTHFILCPLRLMGFTGCPGCGIGHAIAFLLHGDIRSSFHAHWLGIPAFGLFLYRIGTLILKKAYVFTNQSPQ